MKGEKAKKKPANGSKGKRALFWKNHTGGLPPHRPMSTSELRERLESMNVRSTHYSLDGSLQPDAIVLLRNYASWEVFYFDERGGEHDRKVFSSEAEACQHIFEMLDDARATALKFGLNR